MTTTTRKRKASERRTKGSAAVDVVMAEEDSANSALLPIVHDKDGKDTPVATTTSNGMDKHASDNDCDGYCDDDCDDDTISLDSVPQTHGKWNGTRVDEAWRGCTCGIIHARPTTVFWLQCDGPCRAWYNVAEVCVGFTSHQLEAASLWMCPDCATCTASSLLLRMLVAPQLQSTTTRSGPSGHSSSSSSSSSSSFPVDLWYHVLSYCAPPDSRAHVLCHKLAPTCRAAHHALQDGGTMDSLWQLLYEKDFQKKKIIADNDQRTKRNRPGRNISTAATASATPLERKMDHYREPQSALVTPPSTPALPRKRRRRSSRRSDYNTSTSVVTKFSIITSPKDLVQAAHVERCANTEDAHMALAAVCRDKDKPLSLKRLRHILESSDAGTGTGTGGGGLWINRRAPGSGRTFLMVCVAADYVDERVVLRCVKLLVEQYGADLNIWSNAETPYADRTVLYFAMARVMPSVVQYIISFQQVQAARGQRRCRLPVDRTIVVTGRHRKISDPSHTFVGSFTPLEFAQALLRHGRLPSLYWVSKLQMIIRILREQQEQQRQQNQQHGTIRARTNHPDKVKPVRVSPRRQTASLE